MGLKGDTNMPRPPPVITSNIGRKNSAESGGRIGFMKTFMTPLATRRRSGELHEVGGLSGAEELKEEIISGQGTSHEKRAAPPISDSGRG